MLVARSPVVPLPTASSFKSAPVSSSLFSGSDIVRICSKNCGSRSQIHLGYKFRRRLLRLLKRGIGRYSPAKGGLKRKWQGSQRRRKNKGKNLSALYFISTVCLGISHDKLLVHISHIFFSLNKGSVRASMGPPWISENPR